MIEHKLEDGWIGDRTFKLRSLPPRVGECLFRPEKRAFFILPIFCGAKHMKPYVFHINFTRWNYYFAGLMLRGADTGSY